MPVPIKVLSVVLIKPIDSCSSDHLKMIPAHGVAMSNIQTEER